MMDRLYNIARAAHELNKSASWLRQNEKRGRIPRARRDLNGWRTYSQREIDAIRRLLIPDRRN